MLHGDDHKSWLDERVPDWADREPSSVAAAVTPHADEAEYHEVFEDTVDRGRPNVDAGAHAHGGRTDPTGPVDESEATDPEVADALREARELTRQIHRDESGETAADESDETAADESDETDEPSS